VIADLEPPKDNPNAPYVLTEQSPRYRTPFTKETAATYGRKGGLTRGKQIADLAQAGKRAKHQESIQLASSLPELKPKLDSLRRMQRRFMAQAVAENDAKKQALFMRSFQIAFDAEQTLLGNNIKSKRPKSSKLSPHDLPMPDPVSCGMAQESGNRGVNPATAQPASGQATSASTPDSASDCPF
jgi:hypothetical protein